MNRFGLGPERKEEKKGMEKGGVRGEREREREERGAGKKIKIERRRGTWSQSYLASASTDSIAYVYFRCTVMAVREQRKRVEITSSSWQTGPVWFRKKPRG